MFGFEKLEVWRKPIDFADSVYHATLGFPPDEKFGLTSQLRRAAVSISANIAEGSSRSSQRDFARFIEVAYGSLMETVSHTHLAHRRTMITDEVRDQLTKDAEQLARMLSGLKSSL